MLAILSLSSVVGENKNDDVNYWSKIDWTETSYNLKKVE